MDLTSGTPWETVKLTTLSRDRRYFPALLSEAQDLAKASQVGKMIIYTAWGPEWRPFGQPRSKRLLDSVILDKGVKERVVNDIEQFMSRGKWYAERGRPRLLTSLLVLVLPWHAHWVLHRHSISSWHTIARTTGFWQVLFHSSSSWVVGLQYLHPQSLGERLDGR